MPNAITLSGFKEFEELCRDLPSELLEDFDEAAGLASQEWESLAKNAAPVDVGGLKNRISNRRIAVGDWEVTSPSEYSAYMEWGTRTLVVVPPELQAYAAQFKGPTGISGAKEAIFAWCRRVGIEEELWYPVFVKIMVIGVKPQPFFFIHHPVVTQTLLGDLKQIISRPR